MFECLGVKAQIRKYFHPKYQEWYYEVFIFDQRDTKILNNKLFLYSSKIRLFDKEKLTNNLENYSEYQVPHHLW